MKNGRFDLAAVQPIARRGYDEYAVVERGERLTNDYKSAACAPLGALFPRKLAGADGNHEAHCR